ncbi:MAG: hypothetical protein KJ607_03480 [Bacteroidetes bacterium]|nr:hypothetical protein [Bacteroidota bacterium]
MNNKELSKIWLKAAVLGCLWASSEIILGSFFHNLRIPFRSNILASIGVVLMVSVGMLWRQRGLFWRSGLICAAMKTMSPSAVILNPMIAIIMQSLMMEGSTVVFRRTPPGFILGGMLALLWNLVQFIISNIITYGYNIIEVYRRLYSFSAAQTGMEAGGHWGPVLALIAVYAAFGLAAAFLGLYIGNRTKEGKAGVKSISTGKVMQIIASAKTPLRYSTGLLFMNIACIIGVSAMISFLGWLYALPAVAALTAFWLIRYRSSINRLKKPGFWIFFVVVTLLCGLLIGNIGDKFSHFSTTGLITGIEMNLRAVVIILGFAVTGTELKNPAVKKFFFGKRMTQFPLALEVALETLPLAIAGLPPPCYFFRKPGQVFTQMAYQAGCWFDLLEARAKNRENIIIISGRKGEGKTTLLMKVVEKLKEKGYTAGGFMSPTVQKEGVRAGFNIISADNGVSMTLAGTSPAEDLPSVGGFYFYTDAVEFGKGLLSVKETGKHDFVVVDEIGPWELINTGWAPEVNRLVRESDIPMIWVVRETLVAKVTEHWNLNAPLHITAGSNADAAVENIGRIIIIKSSELRPQHN